MFCSRFEQINTAFKQSSDDLKAIRTGIGASAQNEVAALNTALDQLASANEGLRRSAEGSPASAQLQDSRDQALSEIAKRLDVTVTFGPNGVANVDYGSSKLVENTVDLSCRPSHRPPMERSRCNLALTPSTAKGGSLGGLTDSAVVARDRIASLDALAAQYVLDVNSWHQNGFHRGRRRWGSDACDWR